MCSDHCSVTIENEAHAAEGVAQTLVRIGGWMLPIFPPTHVSLDEGGEQVLTNHSHRRPFEVHTARIVQTGASCHKGCSCISRTIRFQSKVANACFWFLMITISKTNI